MATDFRRKAEVLRLEAWEAVKASPDYAAFKAMDDAVVALGGLSHASLATGHVFPKFGQQGAAIAGSIAQGIVMHREVRMPVTHLSSSQNADRRVSHGDAAEISLIKAEEPMTAHDLMGMARTEGAAIGGQNPTVNFTSALSKDDRFYSFRKNGNYFWWLKGVDLPPSWNETEPDEFDGLLGSASSISSNQEGGDGHGPATT